MCKTFQRRTVQSHGCHRARGPRTGVGVNGKPTYGFSVLYLHYCIESHIFLHLYAAPRWRKSSRATLFPFPNSNALFSQLSKNSLRVPFTHRVFNLTPGRSSTTSFKVRSNDGRIQLYRKIHSVSWCESRGGRGRIFDGSRTCVGAS